MGRSLICMDYSHRWTGYTGFFLDYIPVPGVLYSRVSASPCRIIARARFPCNCFPCC